MHNTNVFLAPVTGSRATQSVRSAVISPPAALGKRTVSYIAMSVMIFLLLVIGAVALAALILAVENKKWIETGGSQSEVDDREMVDTPTISPTPQPTHLCIGQYAQGTAIDFSLAPHGFIRYPHFTVLHTPASIACAHELPTWGGGTTRDDSLNYFRINTVGEYLIQTWGIWPGLITENVIEASGGFECVNKDGALRISMTHILIGDSKNV